MVRDAIAVINVVTDRLDARKWRILRKELGVHEGKAVRA
jgi:hypothetical protein